MLMSTINETITSEQAARRAILRRYYKLCRLVRPTMKKKDGQKLKEAFRHVLKEHIATPYSAAPGASFHALEVAMIVAKDIGLGVTSTICALLCRVGDRLGNSPLNNLLSPQETQIIEKLTAVEASSHLGEPGSTVNHIDPIVALSKDPRVILIKIADYLQKMRTLASLSHDQQARVAAEAKYIYAPIAHRLGLHAIKLELEDLHLKFVDSEAYNNIEKQVKGAKGNRNFPTRRFQETIRAMLKKNGFHFTLQARVKSIASIRNKMERLNISFDEVHDLFAIRVIIDAPPDQEKLACWKVYAAITGFYKPHPGKLRNWLSYPRPNGYTSLHTTVRSNEGEWIELQIRTRRMDEVAEKGYAAHWKYKEAGKGGNISNIDNWLNQVRIVLEQKGEDDRELLDTVYADLQIDKMLVFTPDKKWTVLPVGATIIDLAFEVQPNRGPMCTGAKVNGKSVPIEHALAHGDQVDLAFAGKPQATHYWLDWTATHKARNAIRQFLEQKQNETIKQGEKILLQQLSQLRLSYNTEIVEQLLIFFQEEEEARLYHKIGSGSIVQQEIEQFARERHKLSTHSKGPLKAKKLSQFMAERSVQDPPMLTVNGKGITNYQLAPCCNPIPGDKVSGLINAQQVMEIHQETCGHAYGLHLPHGRPITDITWHPQQYSAMELRIESLDQAHTVDAVLRTISKAYPTGVQSVSMIHPKQGVAHISVQLKIKQLQSYNAMIKKLEQLQGVICVTQSISA